MGSDSLNLRSMRWPGAVSTTKPKSSSTTSWFDQSFSTLPAERSSRASFTQLKSPPATKFPAAVSRGIEAPYRSRAEADDNEGDRCHRQAIQENEESQLRRHTSKVCRTNGSANKSESITGFDRQDFEGIQKLL